MPEQVEIFDILVSDLEGGSVIWKN